MNAYEMRNSLNLRNYNTAITREEFEAHFTKTRESIRFTFNGCTSTKRAWSPRRPPARSTPKQNGWSRSREHKEEEHGTEKRDAA